MTKWRPLIVLSLAQFLMVLDTSVMNVAISQLIEDFDAEALERLDIRTLQRYRRHAVSALTKAAAIEGAPLLLVKRDGIPAATQAALGRLGLARKAGQLAAGFTQVATAIENAFSGPPLRTAIRGIEPRKSTRPSAPPYSTPRVREIT